MSTVHVLDENTVNKIAAGEVVERPASVVKELTENAIDAGAKRIEIEIMAGGTSFIRVTDDGCGMSREDARTAIERHATSKITKVSDIESIGTLGFRGEALPTIAAVSHFSMLTRQDGNELGTAVLIDGGKDVEVREAGCNIGTTVKAEDLFFNTPARKKFLKTTHTEGMKISDLLVKLALARSDIAFRFISNNKTAMSTPGNGSLKDTAQSIYGKQLGDSLLPIDFADTDLKISGFITKPSMIRSSRTWQTFIVNGRIIQSKAISKAIDNAYHSLLPKSGYPFAVLLIEVPQNSVDVNVHPQKMEIKFADEGRIFKTVYKAVLDAVRSVGTNLEAVAAVVEKPERHITATPMPMPMQFPEYHKPVEYKPMEYQRPASAPITSEKPAKSFAEVQAVLREEKKPLDTVQYESSVQQTVSQVAEDQDGQEITELDAKLTPIGQVGRCYIVAQDKNGLYIVDQHAAHERIMYDRFSAMAENIPAQQLLVHLVLQFAKSEAELIEKNQELFLTLGFDISPCGDDEFRLTSVPSDIEVSEAEETIREILVALNDRQTVTAAEIRHACIATTACRAAIKAGDELNLRQMQIILDELANTTRPFTCPHGRPTILKFTVDELAKMFKRT